MKILGIDPGYARVGYGIIEKKPKSFDVLEYGCITTSAGTEFCDRLCQISEDLELLLDKHKPDHVAIENLFYFKNKKTVITVAQARGVLMLVPRRNQIPVFEYTPLQIKQAVTGYGKAEKSQVTAMVKSILKLAGPIKLDDTADALAVGICHGNSLNQIAMFNKVK